MTLKLIELEIQNVRGIRHAHLHPGGDSMVIWGPNGAGKSGVVDSIDFLLTGRISRLVGKGTGGITLGKHGPHIDHDPKTAVVTGVFEADGVPGQFTVSRCIETPAQLDCPEEIKETFAAVGNVARRGGVILTRRDILRYVAAEGRTRADDIQELLNLQDVELTRQSLYRARTELTRAAKNAKSAVDQAKAEISNTLTDVAYSDEVLSKAINIARATLGASPVERVKSATLRDGAEPPAQIGQAQPAFNLSLFTQTLAKLRAATSDQALAEISQLDEILQRRIESLTSQPSALAQLEQAGLIRQASGFIDDSTTTCPVCGAVWVEGHLAQHLREKLTSLVEFQAVHDQITEAAASLKAPIEAIRTGLRHVLTTIDTAPLRARLETERPQLADWLRGVDELMEALDDPIVRYPLGDRPPTTGMARPLSGSQQASLFVAFGEAAAKEAPLPTVEQTAWDTLTTLREGVRVLENRQREEQGASRSGARAETLYEAFQAMRDTVLHDLYDRVAGRFSDFYRQLHDHEKDHFNATLEPHGAALNLEVDFLGHGSHPPHALHSEGHQDSMGLCLFLALNEELSQGDVGIVVLDDVVMSVDVKHRKDICRLLSEAFSSTQFLITTHDKTWANQLKQTRVVAASNLIEFTNWTLSSGPRIQKQVGFWEAISNALAQEEVADAAFRLRRGSEDFFETACDALGARIIYNSAGQWQLEDWLFAAMDELRDLLKNARRAAQTWGDAGIIAELDEIESVRKQVFGRTHAEQWAINAAVHYNNWENMTKAEFSDVVDAFRDLQALFKCRSCDGVLQKIPVKGSPQVAKCPCGKMSWNLKSKS